MPGARIKDVLENKFAHTKRLIDFDHPFIADELIRISAPVGQKRHFAKTSKYPPQWRYVSLCLHALRVMRKNDTGINQLRSGHGQKGRNREANNHSAV